MTTPAIPPTPNVADQWRGLSDSDRSEALSRMSDDQKQQLASSLGFQGQSAPTATMSAAPSAFSPAGIKSKIYTARDWVVNNLPQAGGLIGGLIGGTGGVETGPGVIGTAALGAAAGGGLGEDAKQALNQYLHPEDAKMSGVQSGAGMAKAAGSQGLQELGGQVAGRVVGKMANRFGVPLLEKATGTPADQIFQKYPILKSVFGAADEAGPKAAQHLTAAATNNPQTAGRALQDIGNTMQDLEGQIGALPPEKRTVGGFLDAVNTRKDAMNLESGVALKTPVLLPGSLTPTPLSAVQTVPTGVSDNIRNLIRNYMSQTPQGLADRQYIINQASLYQKPWTYGQLDTLRSDLASQLAKHNAQNPVARYVAKKGDLDLAIDNAVLDGLRDTVYPQMDQAAGKPAGYFADLKGRQSSLIQLQEILDKRLENLQGAQALSEVKPLLGPENVSVSAHVGSLPRLGLYGLRSALSPMHEMDIANQHVAAAFPSINSMPYRALFSGTIHSANIQAPPKSKNTQQIELDGPGKWFNQNQ